MALTWTAPAALWLLVAVPLVWLALLVARTNFNRRQQLAQSAVRSLLLVSLVLAMAGPVISTSSSRQSIIYVVDVSHSVSSHAIEAAATKIDEMDNAIRPSHSRIVAFGTTVAIVDSTAELRRLAPIEADNAGARAIDRRGSDLEAALDAARAELATGYIPRIVLFTDGRPTAGDVHASVARLAADGIPVAVEPLAVRSLGDAWVDAIDIPEHIAAGASFAVTVAVGSQRDGDALLELRSKGKVLARQPTRVSKGFTSVSATVTMDAPGLHVLEARVTGAGDPVIANDVLESSVLVEPRAKVLYVEGTAASARYLTGALTGSGFDVSVRPPSGLPTSIAQFDPWDVVVLSDVARSAIPEASIAALTEWVEQRGGGLLVAGGESVYGEGGYRNSPIERLTPVTFERRDEPEVALILVLDRSWSMNGASMELSKAAAQAAVDAMTDEQAIGILTFNDKFDWDVTLRTIGKNREDIRKSIAAIEAGGSTRIYPAIEQAYLALRPAKARAKHVMVLSDGRSYPADYHKLVDRMVDARMTVSSVAVGSEADRELLRNIARWGKGRAYVAADANELPQIFVKEAKSAANPSFDEREFKPIVKAPAFLSGVEVTRMPRLKGRTEMVLKDTALEVVATGDDDPLLAFWPIGLGRTAVFASDVKDRWAADWVGWRGYGPFFSAVVRAIQRRPSPATALDVAPGPIRRGTRSISIAVEARDPDGQYRNLLRPVVQVQSGDRAPVELQARQVAPGRYEASIVTDAAKPVTVTMPPSGNDDPSLRPSRLVLPDPAAEYRFRPPDLDLLQSIATATRGAWRPTPASLANAPTDHRTERRPLWTPLLALALVLWFVDLLLRRVRIFEPRLDAN